MKVIAATKNKGKIREMHEILSPLDIEIVSQQEIGIDVDAEETGDTFEKNALIKARAVAMLCDYPILADDSGICVEALGGAPGVRSARYAGDNATDSDKINKLLSELDGAENRNAKFVTSVAFIFPNGREITAFGEVKGSITHEPKGENGFGYDPVFYSDELGKTFAESSDEEKNSVSHRGRALKSLYEKLKLMEVK
ncbi:MAG: XTP/dITP diphosphatase [Oscillospiraceae bacterium]|nr:XTP/dITP diphosphatase [Oscillospiraceae bacterium]